MSDNFWNALPAYNLGMANHCDMDFQFPLKQKWELKIGKFEKKCQVFCVARDIIVIAKRKEIFGIDVKTGETKWRRKSFVSNHDGKEYQLLKIDRHIIFTKETLWINHIAFDIETGEIVFENHKYYKDNYKPDIFNSLLYDSLFQIKMKKKD